MAEAAAGRGGAPHATRDAAAFIAAETRPQAVPGAPEITLHLADEAVPLWRRTEEELAEIGLPPPFWAFAWAGGQALARYVLDHPETVRGRRVLDFASGSGLVAIAAAMAGAAEVTAADIDGFSRAAIGMNAARNGVQVDVAETDVLGREGDWEVVLAGDIFYDRDLAGPVLAWLRRLQARGAAVLVGDPGRSYLPREDLEALAAYDIPVTRDLEDAEIKRATAWRLRDVA